jgi:hypothetical protein
MAFGGGLCIRRRFSDHRKGASMRWTTSFFLLGALVFGAALVHAGDKEAKCFELRVYYAAPGKFDALLDRFRDHTLKIFKKYDMKPVGFWTPSEGPEKGQVLYYILEFKNREARDTAWKAFRADPDWIKAKEASEVNGKLVDKVVETYMTGTDFSKIK